MEQIRFCLFKKMDQRDFLVTQWIGICLLTQRIQVWSPVPEDPTCCRTSKPLLHTHRGRAPRARGARSPCSTHTGAVHPGPEEPEVPAPHPPGPCTQGQRSPKPLLHTHRGRAPRARGACSLQGEKTLRTATKTQRHPHRKKGIKFFLKNGSEEVLGLSCSKTEGGFTGFVGCWEVKMRGRKVGS